MNYLHETILRLLLNFECHREGRPTGEVKSEKEGGEGGEEEAISTRRHLLLFGASLSSQHGRPARRALSRPRQWLIYAAPITISRRAKQRK